VNIDEKELELYKPTLVYFNDKNEITNSTHSIPVQVA
jgi:aspartate 1-decarboxylase